MIIYEVRAEVVVHRADEWQAWIIPHMQEVVDTGCFTDASLEKIVDPVSERVVFRVRYTSLSMTDIERYLADHAPALRAAGLAAFGDDAHTSRTLSIPLT